MIESAGPKSGCAGQLPLSTHGSLVTVPVHNEAPRIRLAIERLVTNLDSMGSPYLLCVAEDSSTDGTDSILKQLQRDYPSVVVVSRVSARGRGSALSSVWSNSTARAYAYVDADLAMGAEPVLDCLALVLSGQADIAVASRYCAGATVRRPPLVHAVSRCYNRLVRLFFGDGVFDHQCGLKAFGVRAIEQVLPRVEDRGWFWDTEFLVRARVSGLTLREVPVKWTETKNSRTSWRRLASEVPTFLAALLRLRGEIGRTRDGQETGSLSISRSRRREGPAGSPPVQ